MKTEISNRIHLPARQHRIRVRLRFIRVPSWITRRRALRSGSFTLSRGHINYCWKYTVRLCGRRPVGNYVALYSTHSCTRARYAISRRRRTWHLFPKQTVMNGNKKYVVARKCILLLYDWKKKIMDYYKNNKHSNIVHVTYYHMLWQSSIHLFGIFSVCRRRKISKPRVLIRSTISVVALSMSFSPPLYFLGAYL